MQRRAYLAGLVAAALAVQACGDDPTAEPAQPQTVTTATAAEATPTPAAPETTTGTRAQARRGVRLQRIGSFDQPVFVTAPPEDRTRVFVVEQAGRVYVLRRGHQID